MKVVCDVDKKYKVQLTTFSPLRKQFASSVFSSQSFTPLHCLLEDKNSPSGHK